MIQKWGARKVFAVRIHTNKDLLCTTFAVRRLILLVIALGALLVSQPLLRSQPGSVSSQKDIIIILPPPFNPPPNDNFSNAAPVAGNTFSVARSFSSASSEPGEPAHEGHPASHSSWWRWIAPNNGFVEVVVPGISTAPGPILTITDPVYLGFYTGNDLTNLTPVALLPGSSTNIGSASLFTKTYLFQVTAGETYHLAADCASSYRFTFSFANLTLAQPTVFTNLPAKESVTLEFAPFDTNSEIATLQVFAGTNSLLASNSNPFQFQFAAAGQLNVPIWAIGTNTAGQLLISLTNDFTFQPLNDNFADAEIVLPDSSGSFAENTELATYEPGEPDLILGQSPSHTVWWRWTPPYNVPTQVRLTSWSSRLAIFKGTDLANLELVSTLQTGSNGILNFTSFSFMPDSGTTYYIVGEGSPILSWDFDQETLLLNPGNPFVPTDAPIALEAIWRESNSPSSSIEFVIGQLPGTIPISGPTPDPVEIGLAGSVALPPYRITWTPATYGTFYLWARCTNEFGSLRQSPKTEFRVYVSNDDFVNAAIIPGDVKSNNFAFNMVGATMEPAEPWHGKNPPYATRWWKWTPTYSGAVRIKAVRELQGVPLEVFIGYSLNNLRPIASNWRKTYRFGVSGALRVPVRAGMAYFIRVDDTSPGSHNWTVPASDIMLSLEPAINRPRAELLLSLQRKNPHADDFPGSVASPRVLMPDGTPVSDPSFRAQLYVGTNESSLSPVGPAQPFRQYPSSYLGTPWPVPVILSNIKAHSRVFAQLRVWNIDDGDSYEAAKAASSLIGESKILKLIAGSEDSGPAALNGIDSFKLHTP